MPPSRAYAAINDVISRQWRIERNTANVRRNDRVCLRINAIHLRHSYWLIAVAMSRRNNHMAALFVLQRVLRNAHPINGWRNNVTSNNCLP